MRRKMSEEITKSEMLSLREKGYSNSEIAEQLECCYATVLRYIGKSGMRRPTKSMPDKIQKEIIKPKNRLHLVSKQYNGEAAAFNLTGEYITIIPHHANLCFEKKEFEELAKDIVAVSQIVGRGNDIQL